jgi:hypothetical protein
MKKKFLALVALLLVAVLTASCSMSDLAKLFESDESLGKTNNTAVAIADAMDGYLEKKKMTDQALYGVEMNLNSDSNGLVKLYYSAVSPEEAKYEDIYVAEVDSKTGHVERFGKVDFKKEGKVPFQLVKQSTAFDAGTLPIDSGKAISTASRIFNENADFYYDYVYILLSAPDGKEIYEIEFISMLNDQVYHCTVDAVSGAVLEYDQEALD